MAFGRWESQKSPCWFLLLMFIQIRSFVHKKKSFFEFWVGELSVGKACGVYTSPSPILALEIHEMLIRADSALTNV